MEGLLLIHHDLRKSFRLLHWADRRRSGLVPEPSLGVAFVFAILFRPELAEKVRLPPMEIGTSL